MKNLIYTHSVKSDILNVGLLLFGLLAGCSVWNIYAEGYSVMSLIMIYCVILSLFLVYLGQSVEGKVSLSFQLNIGTLRYDSPFSSYGQSFSVFFLSISEITVLDFMGTEGRFCELWISSADGEWQIGRNTTMPLDEIAQQIGQLSNVPVLQKNLHLGTKEAKEILDRHRKDNETDAK